MTASFVTFGCRLSRAEALDEEARCRAAGVTVVDDNAQADIIVVRCCSVTAKAQVDCEKEIARLRRKHAGTRILVRGCHPESQIRVVDPIADRIAAHFGTQPPPPRPVPMSTARAYLKVQDGCAGACSFCTVPKFRGASASVPFEDVLARARDFVDAGYSEIVVTGCNLALYASDGKRLADLVAALADLSPGVRIRVGSVEPGTAADELVDAMAGHGNICRFLHLPVQSGSDRILAAMRRPYRARDVDRVVRAALKAMPRIGLGCDLMTGFPGETDMDFTATCGLLKRMPFTNVHVFPFSERPGTPAATMPCTVPRDLRSARAHVIAEYAMETRRTFAKSFIGHTVEMVVENEAEGAGWTSEYLWCKVPNPDVLRLHARRRDMARILVVSAHGGVLTGDPLRHGR